MMLVHLETWAVRVLSALAGTALLFMMLLTFVDVFLRYWFARPINGSGEMIAFALALMVFSAFPMVTYEDGHISVSLLKGRLSPAAAWIEKLLVLLFSLAASLMVTYELFVHGNGLAENQQATPVLTLPLAPLSYAMSVFAGMSSVAVIVLLIAHLRGSSRHVAAPPDSQPGYEV